MNEEFRVSQHIVKYELPDIVFLKFIGDITGPDVSEITAACKPWMIDHEYLLLLVDLSDMGRALPDARTAGKEKGEYEMRGTAFFGASPRIRILVNLVVSALNILLKRIDNPVRFFATEAQARAWLSERRKILTDCS
jgi:hypothetical protein